MNEYRRARRWALLAFWMFLLAASLSACARGTQVTVEADGLRHTLRTQASTVRGVLKEAGITLGELDRVEPDLWVEVTPGMTITVIRVEEKLETRREPIPFQRRTVRSEALQEGERRLVQLGADGEAEVVYRITLEDGVEVSRVEISRRVVRPPREEIVVVGLRSNLPSVPISGTIAYISGGNAWLMRGSSGSRRPLTSSGDLDGRAFSLSPDGRYLLFSRSGRGESTALNSLWVITTTVVGESPWPLGIKGVLFAEWAPAGETYRFAYSTAERTKGAPGWKANNDLWVATLLPEGKVETRQVLSPSLEGPYSWWGARYAWSPDGQCIAYADAGEIGIIRLPQGERIKLLAFPPYHTYGEWVWTPYISWSPDGRFLVATVHVPSGQEERPEDSPLFQVWAIGLEGKVQAPLVEEAGMWANPLWSPAWPSWNGESCIAYGLAWSPLDSQNSLYDLYVMDRDGSNDRQIRLQGFPALEAAWSPLSPQLVAVHQGNLYLVDLPTGKVEQLTGDGQARHPQWAR